MNKLRNLAAVVLYVALLGGCHSVSELRQPSNVPVFVESYDRPNLIRKTGNVPCTLNLVNCTEMATLVVNKLSGATAPGPSFPVRAVVMEECGPLISSNFRQVIAAEQAKIELKIESRKVMLVRDGNDLTFSLSLAIMLLNPHHQDKPYFSKVYEVGTFGTMTNEELVPNCVYEAVQRILANFISEVNADEYLVARLDELVP